MPKIREILLVTLAFVAACSKREDPVGPDRASEPAAQAVEMIAARTATPRASHWNGPWQVQVAAPDPEDTLAVAVGAGLGHPVTAWEGGRATTPGTLLVLVVGPPFEVDGLTRRIGPAGAVAGGETIVVVDGQDGRWAASAAGVLPWSGIGVCDPVASAALWMDPRPLGEAVLGRVAARTIADAYALPYVPGSQEYPPGLDAWLGAPGPHHLASHDPRTRAEAARTLGTDTLARDPEVAVRLAVASRSTSPTVLAALAKDPEPLVRARAADNLRDLAVLDSLLADGSFTVRVVAAHRIAALAPDPSLDPVPVLTRLTRAPEAALRWKAAWGLGARRGLTAGEGTAPLIVPLLADRAPEVRREAARALGQLADPVAVDALMGASRDPHATVRRAVIEALGQFATDPVVRTALDLARDDADGKVAASARRALGEEPGPPVEGAAEEEPPAYAEDPSLAAQSADARVRWRAAMDLASAGPGQAIEALLPDADERVRAVAVALFPSQLAPGEASVHVRRAAAENGAPATGDALVRAVRDESLALWARGILHREDELLRQRLTWNDPNDRPTSWRQLLPPGVVPHGSSPVP